MICGHNIDGFDIHHLRGLGLSIQDEQVIDTLMIARLLYPDNLHHNLGALAKLHGIALTATERHSALPDARACALLLVALGDELFSRDPNLLTGIRAFTPQGSAFDRVLLTPRDAPADPTLEWALSPAPSPPRVLVEVADVIPSPGMIAALEGDADHVVEHLDRNAAYVAELPSDQRVLLTVATRGRLERALTVRSNLNDVYVLPDSRSLLCPERMRQMIGEEPEPARQRELFCLYQASHNHDAATLYPFRLPSDDTYVDRLRATLRAACCWHDDAHRAYCPGHLTIPDAGAAARILFTTHEALVHQSAAPHAHLAIIDDVDALSTGLAENVSTRVLDADVANAGAADALAFLTSSLQAYAETYLPLPAYRERVPLASVVRFMAEQGLAGELGLARALESMRTDEAGRMLASHIHSIIKQVETPSPSPEYIHTQWLELEFGDDVRRLTRWSMHSISVALPQLFSDIFWRPYHRHIVCGSAITLGGVDITFLQRALGLPSGLPVTCDPRPHSEVVLFSPDVIRPSGFLNRRAWAMDSGAVLYSEASTSVSSLALSVNNAPVSSALATAFRSVQQVTGRRVLDPRGGWTVSKIAERMIDPDYPVLAILAPKLRRTALDVPVHVEASGPLRFLNQRDPLVAAQMRVFRSRFPKEGPFNAYLLPQALLELKTRLAAPAQRHLVLDSRLLARSYRDEVLEVIGQCADVQFIERRPELAGDAHEFLKVLDNELTQAGLPAHTVVGDEDLYLILRTLWDAEEFRPFKGSGKSQKEVVRQALEGHDQLVVAATGGGKSLCFQLPAVILAEDIPPKVTIVVSPLIALMKNQVDDLNRKGIFSAILLNSTLDPAQRQEHLRGVKRGDYSIIYMAPEQIHSSGLRRALQERQIGLIAIDEAHCMSQWGHDFRTDYFALKKWIDRVLVRNGTREFPILALTATARQPHKNVADPSRSDTTSTVDDIIVKLALNNAVPLISSTERDELQFRVERITPDVLQCRKCQSPLQPEPGWITCRQCQYRQRISDQDIQAAVEAAKQHRLQELFLDEGPNGLAPRWNARNGRQRGLVYCSYRRTTEEIADLLRQQLPQLRVAAYHAGMDGRDRDETLRRFTSDGPDGLDVVVATNAFGMGIDVRRLGYVVHFDVPGTLEAYYQEAGRAGRDPLFNAHNKAACVLLYHPSDLQKQQLLRGRNTITPFDIQEVYDTLRSFGHDEAITHDGEREIIAAEADIAALASVDEEQVATILYYLEYQTKAGGKAVLERGETANRVWRLQLEPGYCDKIEVLPESSKAKELLRLFLEVDEFRLNDYSKTAVALGDLRESLRLPYARIEDEILNLARRRIIAYACDGRLCWTRDAAAAHQVLDLTRKDIRKLLRDINVQQKDRLAAGETVYADLGTFVPQGAPFDRLAHMLFALSRDGMEPLRVFDRFARAIRSAKPMRYEVRIWGQSDLTVNDRVDKLFAELHTTVDRLNQLGVQQEWQPFDLLQVEPDYYMRQRMHRYLLLLSMLGLINYVGDPSMGLALNVRLLQPTISADMIKIDLASLRQKEMYEKHKLKLLDHYAALLDEAERTKEIDSYFRADKPLVERLDVEMFKEVTDSQQAVIYGEGGVHLIEGPAGCGKTTTLVERIKHLVYHHHVPLDRIMVTTHFHSAVGRIGKQLEALREDGTVALATTINSFGEGLFRKHRMRLLRPDGELYYPSEPHLVKDDRQSKEELTFINAALELVHSGGWPHEGWPEDLAHPSFSPGYRRNATTEDLCYRAAKRLREYGIFPTLRPTSDEIANALGASGEYGPMDQKLEPEYDVPELYAVYVTVLQLMGEKGRYTYDDQVLFALAILGTRPELLREYGRAFEHVIVDELQDFTPAAVALFDALSSIHKNVLAFGDQDQAIRIKASRAGDVFEKLRTADDCGHAHQLRTNFRSMQEILDLAVDVRNLDERHKLGPLVAARGMSGCKPVRVRVRTSRELPNRVAFGELLDAAFEQLAEAPDDETGTVGIIVPRRDWRHTMEELLIERGIKFSVLNGKSQYQAPHIDNVLVYYRLIVSPQNDDDVAQVLRQCVVPYLDYRQIKTLQNIALDERLSLFNVLVDTDALAKAKLSDEQRAALRQHHSLIGSFQVGTPSIEVEQALRNLEHGPVQVLDDQPEKYNDVDRVLRSFRGKTVGEVVTDVERHKLFLETNRGQAGLVLTTIDHAKSEEFDTVVIIGDNHLADRRDKLRLYVSVSRARDRLYLLRDEQGGRGLIDRIRHDRYRSVWWQRHDSPARGSDDSDTDLPF
ncbi:MAG: DEAD/DEAH box helicase [Chloroflexota bacterium]|nr:DEAD/DEAH box helicase [Chloroflexota bacterium]